MKFNCGKSMAVVALGMLVLGGCKAGQEVHKVTAVERDTAGLSFSLVMPGEPLVDLVGLQAWPAGEMNELNHRRNDALGADRIPLMASVNLAEIRVWDQQWILNGRSLENYLRSTRSIQKRDLP